MKVIHFHRGKLGSSYHMKVATRTLTKRITFPSFNKSYNQLKATSALLSKNAKLEIYQEADKSLAFVFVDQNKIISSQYGELADSKCQKLLFDVLEPSIQP